MISALRMARSLLSPSERRRVRRRGGGSRSCRGARASLFTSPVSRGRGVARKARSRTPDRARCPADPRGNPDDRAQAAQSVEHFAQALQALPDEQREAFLLREEAGLSLAEIAAATGVTAETAKSRLRYAVGKLRRALAAPDD